MEITIDTSKPLSDLDLSVLAVLLDGDKPAVKAYLHANPDETEEPQEAAPAPVKPEVPKPVVQRPVAVATATVKPALATTRPVAPKPAAATTAPAKATETTPAPAPAAPVSANGTPTQEDAVTRATALISKGKQSAVRAALTAVGVQRVGQLTDENIEQFMAELDRADA